MEAKNIAIVLIHGIGDITKGSVINAAVNAIKDNLSSVSISPPVSLPSSLPLEVDQGQANLTEVKLGWHEHGIRLVEFQWASVIGKIRPYRPLDAMIKLLRVLLEFPLLGTVGLKSTIHRIYVTAFGLLHQIFIIAFVFLLFWVLVAELQHYEDYAKVLRPILDIEISLESTSTAEWGEDFGTKVHQLYETHSYWGKSVFGKLLIIIPMYCFIVIPVLLLFSTIDIVVHFRVPSAAAICLGIAISALLMFFAWMSLIISAIFLFVLILNVIIGQPIGPAAAIFSLLIFLFIGWLLLKVTAVLANLLRDVVHYLAPGTDGKPQIHQEKIRLELEDLLQRLGSEGVDRIVLVAHSLGTIIAADMLLKIDADGQEIHRVPVDLVTAGSPLHRLINRMLPQRMPRPQKLRLQLAGNNAYPVQRWFNVYRLFDYVGQALTYSALLLDLFPYRRKQADPESSIEDRLLKPRYIWPFGHANYWSDKRFLDLLVNNVIVTALHYKRN